MQEQVSLLIVDDHELVRLGIRSLLEDVPWVTIVAEAGTAAQAIDAAAKHHPHIVIMDIRLPHESGIEACQQITRLWPEIRVIMLTSFMDDDLIFRAIQAGASGYVLKQVGNQSLLNALEAVRDGEALLDTSVTQRILLQMRQHNMLQQENAFKELSEREREVLLLLTRGYANVKIATSLNLSEKTVRNHVSSILSKLKLLNRTEAIAYALQHNLEGYGR